MVHTAPYSKNLSKGLQLCVRKAAFATGYKHANYELAHQHLDTYSHYDAAEKFLEVVFFFSLAPLVVALPKFAQIGFRASYGSQEIDISMAMAPFPSIGITVQSNSDLELISKIGIGILTVLSIFGTVYLLSRYDLADRVLKPAYRAVQEHDDTVHRGRNDEHLLLEPTDDYVFLTPKALDLEGLTGTPAPLPGCDMLKTVVSVVIGVSFLASSIGAYRTSQYMAGMHHAAVHFITALGLYGFDTYTNNICNPSPVVLKPVYDTMRTSCLASTAIEGPIKEFELQGMLRACLVAGEKWLALCSNYCADAVNSTTCLEAMDQCAPWPFYLPEQEYFKPSMHELYAAKAMITAAI